MKSIKKLIFTALATLSLSGMATESAYLLKEGDLQRLNNESTGYYQTIRMTHLNDDEFKLELCAIQSLELPAQNCRPIINSNGVFSYRNFNDLESAVQDAVRSDRQRGELMVGVGIAATVVGSALILRSGNGNGPAAGINALINGGLFFVGGISISIVSYIANDIFFSMDRDFASDLNEVNGSARYKNLIGMEVSPLEFIGDLTSACERFEEYCQ